MNRICLNQSKFVVEENVNDEINLEPIETVKWCMDSNDLSDCS